MSSDRQQQVAHFQTFYTKEYKNIIEEFIGQYPENQKSLYISHNDLSNFHNELAETYLAAPHEMQNIAERALCQYAPEDVALKSANVRLVGLPENRSVSSLAPTGDAAQRTGELVSLDVSIQEVADSELVLTEAAFECQRCGTMTYIPQSGDELQEPYECQGCERQGPFRVNHDHSEAQPAQQVTITDNEYTNRTIQLTGDLCESLSEGTQATLVGVPELGSSKGKKYKLHFTTISINNVRSVGTIENRPELPDIEEVRVEVTEAINDWADATDRVLTTHDTNRMEEWSTQTKLVTPLLAALGWPIRSPHVYQEQTPPGFPQSARAKQVDYTLYDSEQTPVIVVEAKQIGSRLESSPLDQVIEYMRLYEVGRALLTTGERILGIKRIEESNNEEVIINSAYDNLGKKSDQLLQFTPQGVDVEI